MTATTRRRTLMVVWLAAYLAWYWIAPAIAGGEEGEWMPMWLNLTMPGAILGIWACIRPTRWPVLLFAAATAIHFVFGLGYHPL